MALFEALSSAFICFLPLQRNWLATMSSKGGGDKIGANTDDGKALFQLFTSGAPQGRSPKEHFESPDGDHWRSNCDFAPFQTAWDNTKTRAGKHMGSDPRNKLVVDL